MNGSRLNRGFGDMLLDSLIGSFVCQQRAGSMRPSHEMHLSNRVWGATDRVHPLLAVALYPAGLSFVSGWIDKLISAPRAFVTQAAGLRLPPFHRSDQERLVSQT